VPEGRCSPHPLLAARSLATPDCSLDRGVSLEDCSQDAVQDLRREEGNRGDVLGLITTLGINQGP